MDSLELVLRNKLLATGLALAVSALPALVYAVSSYRGYVAFGPHGLPDTFRGWLKQVSWHRIARTDTRVPAPYDEAALGPIYEPESKASYFAGQPPAPRAGPRPTVPSYCAPQRQTSQAPSPAMLQKQNDFFDAVAAANPSLFDIGTSGIEKQGKALWIGEGHEIPAQIRFMKGEFTHIHPEGSTHLILSLPDSAAVIENGWGERHKLSGPFLPWGYTLVYGPRDEEEFRAWAHILRASVTYFARGKALEYPA